MALRHPPPVARPLTVTQQRADEARSHAWVWTGVLLGPWLILALWPILLVAVSQVACWYAGWTARPSRWVVWLNWCTVTMLAITFEWWHWLPAYGTSMLAWTWATVLHVRAGLPLWDPVYLTDMVWLLRACGGTALVAGLWLAGLPGVARVVCLSAARLVGQRTDGVDVPRLAFTTAGELAHRPVPIIRGLWGTHFPKASLTTLHAREKLGKSTFLTSLFASFGDGSPFFGQETVPCTLLYATEETADVFRDKAERLPAHVAVVTSDQVSGLLTWDNWPAVLEVLLQRAQRVGARLLIIDTLGHWMPGAELGTVRAQQTVYVLKQAVTRGISILLVHHDAKRGQARGPVALMAGMDRVIHLEPVEGDATLRRLCFSGRFASRPPEDVVYRMAEDGALVLLEDEPGENAVPGEGLTQAPAGPLDGPCRAILAYLTGTEQGGAERVAIGAAIGMKKNATYDHLDHLASAGKIVVEGKGVAGDPRVYWLPERVPSEVPEEETVDV